MGVQQSSPHLSRSFLTLLLGMATYMLSVKSHFDMSRGWNALSVREGLNKVGGILGAALG
jgi:hypothetical protein